MAKRDKSKYTKQEWLVIREQRRVSKMLQKAKQQKENSPLTNKITNKSTAFVLGNGTSRANIDPSTLRPFGNIYGCNALYRTFNPDYLVAVDTKMILEINKSGYQNHNEVWTNPNKVYHRMTNFNYFSPSKGWSSGPTALWLATQHGYEHIYILGFDYQGLDSGKKFNNLYADTKNYKKSTEGATFYGNWMRQTKSVVQDFKDIKFTRVITPDNYVPEELNKFENLEHISVEMFKKIYNLA